MKYVYLILLLIALILLATSCAAPPPESGMPEKTCPKREVYIYDTQVANIEIYNQLPTTTLKF